jgi:ABC-type uncharacterized transport system auxiliary subunit
MKKFVSALLAILTIFSCCTMMGGCESNKKKNHQYSYYTRSDGKRIWYKNY